jgi:predicted TPR repeat methyltransferase
MSETAQVTTYFNAAAHDFDRLYGETGSNFLMRFINRTFRKDIYERFAIAMEHAKTSGIKSLLDVGCGSGRYASAFTEMGLENIVGIDCSQAMIDLADKIISGSQDTATTFSFVCDDFMSYATNMRFDLVLAMGVFDYIKDPIPFLSKMIGLSDHSVVASFPSVSAYRTPIRKVRYYIKACPVYFYTRESIETLFASVGYRDVQIRKIPGAGMDYVAILEK